MKPNLEKLNSLISTDIKSNFETESKFRQENEAWLSKSFSVAILVLNQLHKNKIENKKPKSQNELAEILKVSPQYINKIVKGKEKLNLETITKIEEALGISILNIPKVEKTYTFSIRSKSRTKIARSNFSIAKKEESLKTAKYFTNQLELVS